MVLAPKLGQAPRAIASQLVTALEGVIPQITSVEVAGPGFLNFKVGRDFYQEKIIGALQNPRWGSNQLWAGKTVVVEYTDPNPFKEFHIGHLFTNAVGESIARLFMMNGADTKRVNYQGDVGLHVACAVWGMQQLDFMTEPFTAKELGKAYALGATTYKTNDIAALGIREINKKFTVVKTTLLMHYTTKEGWFRWHILKLSIRSLTPSLTNTFLKVKLVQGEKL